MTNAVAGSPNHQDHLNRLTPGAYGAKLGDCVYDLINHLNALLTKLDTANLAGMGATNSATFATKLPEAR